MNIERDLSGKADFRTTKFFHRLPLFLALVSLFPRLIRLDAPILEYHPFRQTQTAITVWTMVTDGLSVWNYKTPVFGRPWQVPFEFPTFQAAAALLGRTHLTLDAACRLTDILFFYISAFFLYRLCRFLVGKKRLCLWILGFYLFCPYNLVWSRTCMIDYASVAFALAYVFFLLRWIERDTRWDCLGLASAFGSLGYLTKVTTMPIVVPIVAYAAYRRLVTRDSLVTNPESPRRVRDVLFWALFLAVLIIPFLLAVGWTYHTDQVKSGSVATQWLMVKNLSNWSYGTLWQRLDPRAWFKILRRIFGLLAITPALAGILKTIKAPRTEQALFWTSTVAVLLPVLVFFNLFYVHDYYLISITPFVAITAGYGLCALWEELPDALWIRATIWSSTLLCLLSSAIYARRAYAVRSDDAVCQVGKAIDAVTPPGAYVVIDDYDWNPALLYYAKRKGLMLTGPHPTLPETNGGYTTVVVSRPHPELLALWKYHVLQQELFGFSIYRVSETQP